MEKLIAAFVNRSPALPAASADGLRYTGWEVAQIISCMAVPLLAVLLAGLYFLSLSRRRLPLAHD